MMKLITILLFCIPASLLSQERSALTQLTPEDLPGAEISRNEVYDSQSVWSYLDDKTALYTEYAFLNLRVQDVVRHNIKLKVEIYRMKNASSAFGIYSIIRSKCSETNLFTSPDCLGNYHYQAAKGPVFVSVINSSGNPAAVEFTRETAQALMKKVIGNPYDLKAFDMFPDSIANVNNVMLARGAEAINKAIPQWKNLFEDMVGYDMFLLTLERAPGKIILAEVDFPSESQLETFILQNIPDANLEKEQFFFTQNGQNLGILKIDERHIRMYQTKSDASVFKSILSDFGF